MNGMPFWKRQRNETVNNNTCLIIAGAPECRIPENRAGADFIIACDYGLHHALTFGISPHLIIGDFDSYRGTLPKGIPVRRHPPEKDDTDTMLAVKEALERGYRRIVIAGGLGGRIDHQLANLSAAAFAAERGAHCVLVDDQQQIFALRNGSCRISAGQWTNLSVFAFSDRAEGVTLKGVKYPLSDDVLTNSFPLGVSNSFAADTAEISVRQGILLIVLS